MIQKSVLARVSPLQVTWLGCAFGALVCLPFAPTLARELDGAGAAAIGGVVYLGLAPTALGFATCYVRAAPDERRPPRLAQVPDPGRRDPARLGASRRDAAAAGRRRRGAVRRRRLPRPPPLRTPLRSRFGLSRELWLVQAGIFLNMLGYGAVLPFEVIYLHDGRGFSLGVAGLVVGTLTGARRRDRARRRAR